MQPKFTPAELEGFLDESLPSEMMAAVEAELRANADLARQVAETIARRDAGVHTVGGIWRGERLTCATREQLGSFLLEAMENEELRYWRFHLEIVGCRFCQANLSDLKELQSEGHEAANSRRRKFFQSSAGYLRRE